MRKKSGLLKWVIVGILVVFALFHLVTYLYTSRYEVKEELTTNNSGNPSITSYTAPVTSYSDMSSNGPSGFFGGIQSGTSPVTSYSDISSNRPLNMSSGGIFLGSETLPVSPTDSSYPGDPCPGHIRNYVNGCPRGFKPQCIKRLANNKCHLKIPNSNNKCYSGFDIKCIK